MKLDEEIDDGKAPLVHMQLTYAKEKNAEKQASSVFPEASLKKKLVWAPDIIEKPPRKLTLSLSFFGLFLKGPIFEGVRKHDSALFVEGK